ncbi:putative archaeal flagellar protein FlaH [Methanocella conradii HZ254]|uniref:Archaeal flagellar protein FlaH n=1 Tax=Methanocella conradii (strain DSM 24694 / JCM 17849 / CGMCC 1.5162 / HZ254) TaxID=1041930 RepID=H8I4S7_METCZ|nr:ATPase domain-containing protein [Methanocella conradii]AFD00672.1 putative archaeal flagellar protein FlaH [Methanocella conradii HZ254]MDI6896370.1 ATPase domain-containing protein [Methanocella conradii]
MAEIDSNEVVEKQDVISTGNPEIDKKIADGLPLNSLTLIEGANGTGKSVMTQQILWGGLVQGYSFALYTTEKTIRGMLSQMESLGLDVSDYFAWGYLKIYPIQVEGAKMEVTLSKLFLQRLVDYIRKEKEDIIIIDSFTIFTIGTPHDDIFNFLTECKSLCDKGKTILIALHSYAFDEDTLARIRSIADNYIKLKIEQMGDKNVNMMEVIKVRGAKKVSGNIISFEIHPEYGIEVVPYTSIAV